MAKKKISEISEVSLGGNTSPKGDPDQRSRNWCFTLNNWNDEEVELLKSMETRYICWGEETCPTTGTPHLQGWVVFKNQKKFKELHKKLRRVSWRKQLGDNKQARDYCVGGVKGKPVNEVFFEQGICPKQGERSDLKEAAKALRNWEINHYEDLCDDDENLFLFHTYGRTLRTVQKIRDWKRAKRDYSDGWKPKVQVFWSEKSGVGKTTAVWNLNNQNVTRLQIGNKKIWIPDTYRPGDAVLLDDFKGETIEINELKVLLDGFPKQLENKGGITSLVRSDIYITSQHHPNDWYKDADAADLMALTRRMQIFNFDNGIPEELNTGPPHGEEPPPGDSSPPAGGPGLLDDSGLLVF